MAPLPPTVRTLGGMFDHAADRHPTRDIRSFFAEESLTFRQLARNGHTVARRLLAAGIAPGVPVAVLIQSNLKLLQALAGVAATGAVIVPLSVSIGLNKAYLARLDHVIEDCGIRFAVVDDAYAEHFAELLPHIATFTLSSLTGEPAAGETELEVDLPEVDLPEVDLPEVDLPEVDEEDLALIQYTSGSTSYPRGVALTHRNLLAGIRALHHGVGPREGDVLCHWLPLSHDMGLFSTLAGLGAGIDIRLSPPQDFIKYPDDWLRAFCAFGASILVGPNFSYRYLLDAIPEEETAGYDLSTLRVILNGAEPIDPDIPAAFARHFAAAGLRPGAMTPCYGLAEATLAVTSTPVDRTATVDWVDRTALNGTSRAEPAEPGSAGARGIVSCGSPVPGVEVRIAKDSRALAERVVGDIEIRGEPVMRGYYKESEASVSPDGWCSTGDLGYLADGCLHVTGRRKEMMILRGRNYYPQDIEDAIREVLGVHKGHAVAVVLPADPAGGLPERIGVLAEVSTAAPPHAGTVSAIREAAAGVGGASVDVVLMRRNALLRTTSGKYQRLLMRGQLLEGTLRRVVIHVAADSPLPADTPASGSADGSFHERSASSPT